MCLDVFHPATHWVRAVVDRGAVLCDGNQVAARGLQDAALVVSAYEEENVSSFVEAASSSPLSCDIAIGAIAQVVDVHCVTIFLNMNNQIRANLVSCCIAMLTIIGAILYVAPSLTLYSLYKMYGDPDLAATSTLISRQSEPLQRAIRILGLVMEDCRPPCPSSISGEQ